MIKLEKDRAESIINTAQQLIKSCAGGTDHIKSCDHIIAYTTIILLRAIEQIGCTIQPKYFSKYSGYDSTRRMMYLGDCKIKKLRQRFVTMLVNDYLQTVRNYILAFLLGRFTMFYEQGECYTFQSPNMKTCEKTAEIILFADCLLIPIDVFLKLRFDEKAYEHMSNAYPTVVKRWESRLKNGELCIDEQ